MANVYFHGTRFQAMQVAQRLADTLTGKAQDTLGIARGVFLAIGFAALSDIKADFVRKARGGTGEDGSSWPKLSRKYLAYGRRFGPGEQKSLKSAAGLGKAHNRGVAGNKGLLTAAQVKRWNAIFAQSMQWLMVSMPVDAAKRRAAQIAWSKLKAEGAKTKLQVYGSRDVEILRDTGILLNSLSPGQLSKSGPGATYAKPTSKGGDQQIFSPLSNGVIVGTNVKYAGAHNNGNAARKIPKRQFLPTIVPEIWWQRWLAVADKALLAGARMAYEAGPI